MKILVLGSSGMVGSALKRRQGAHTLALRDHCSFEISNPAHIREALSAEKPDVVINTVAYLGVEPCAGNPVRAFTINSKAVADLAAACNFLDVCLVQISTDAVFDGEKGEPYTELDIPQPVNTYGMTKYMGELYTRNLCRRYYIIRIPILFGIRENQGSIFIEKMYALAKSGRRELHIADDVVSCPSFSDDIAGGILDFIDSGRQYGIYHLKNEGTASLFEFASAFFRKMGSDTKILRAKARDFTANETEKKPLNTAIRSTRLPHLRDWQEAMDDFVEQFKGKSGTG